MFSSFSRQPTTGMFTCGKCKAKGYTRGNVSLVKTYISCSPFLACNDFFCFLTVKAIGRVVYLCVFRWTHDDELCPKRRSHTQNFCVTASCHSCDVSGRHDNANHDHVHRRATRPRTSRCRQGHFSLFKEEFHFWPFFFCFSFGRSACHQSRLERQTDFAFSRL